MQRILGMPLAIVACFLIGVVLSVFSLLPVVLAAFFLAVGLTCLTYSYLGGQLDASRNEGSGTFGLLSFKLTGSLVTFLVSFLFLNHHLSLSRVGENRTLSLQSGPDDIRVEAGSQRLGLLQGSDLERWASDLARDDYFHPALILARRPFCSVNPARCVSLAGFYAVAARSTKVERGTMKLCVIDQSYPDIKDALDDSSMKPLLNHLEIDAETAAGQPAAEPLKVKAAYVESGSLLDRCRRVSIPNRVSSNAIRLAALMNPADLETIRPQSGAQPVVVKVNFLPES